MSHCESKHCAKSRVATRFKRTRPDGSAAECVGDVCLCLCSPCHLASQCSCMKEETENVMQELTPKELRLLYEMIRLYDAPRTDRRADDPWVPLLDKLRTMIAERAGTPSWGALVFSIELPLDLAPTLNRYGSMEGWMQKNVRKAVDLRILAERNKWPGSVLRTPRRRAVRVTRFSSSVPDELGVDVLGGKIPVDRLVVAGILAGDTRKVLERDGRHEQCPPKAGKLLVQVFELS